MWLAYPTWRVKTRQYKREKEKAFFSAKSNIQMAHTNYSLSWQRKKKKLLLIDQTYFFCKSSKLIWPNFPTIVGWYKNITKHIVYTLYTLKNYRNIRNPKIYNYLQFCFVNYLQFQLCFVKCSYIQFSDTSSSTKC